MKDGIVITISRESYSGGDELAAGLAKALGFKLYDKEIITLASQASGIHEDHFGAAEQKPNSSLLYSVVMGMYSSRGAYVKLDDVLTDDKIYKAQADTIRETAKSGNCVFVGRCSDYILRNHENCVHVFLRASDEDRRARVMKEQDVSDAEAKKIVSRSDKKRKSYYDYYTNREWGDIRNYDLSLNLSKLSVDAAIEVIKTYVEKM